MCRAKHRTDCHAFERGITIQHTGYEHDIQNLHKFGRLEGNAEQTDRQLGAVGYAAKKEHGADCEQACAEIHPGKTLQPVTDFEKMFVRLPIKINERF